MSTGTVGAAGRILLPALLLIGLVAGPAVFAAGAAGNDDQPDFKPTPLDSGKSVVDILYVTDRAHGDGDSSADYYGDQRGDLRYGRCAVRYSPIPGLAGIADKAPFYLPDEMTKVEQIIEFDDATFWRFAVDDLAPGEKVVFKVHGYNMSFPRACRHAARLQRDLGNDARVVLFSWPSDGGLLSYSRDETDAAWSVPNIERVIARLSERLGPGRVQVLAHSLGTRSVTRALLNLGCARADSPSVDQLVFIGPDIDADGFLDALPGLRRVTRRISIYASSNDTPLKVSRQVHGYPRLGEAGDYLVVVPGMETIDVSTAPVFEVSGHLYHLYNPHVSADVVRLLRTGQGAAKRPGLRSRQRDALTYWEIVPES